MGRWWVLGMHAYLDHPSHPGLDLAVFALAAVQRLPHNGLSGTLPDAALGTLANYFIGINFNGKLHDFLGCVCLLLDVECCGDVIPHLQETISLVRSQHPLGFVSS